MRKEARPKPMMVRPVTKTVSEGEIAWVSAEDDMPCMIDKLSVRFTHEHIRWRQRHQRCNR